ncbi:hypothetical protein NQ318_022022 [Aromia moschata]|uniref:Membrane protein BRI3 n=1 Tax=Aromia moschata TaxID=1265417 RepID=A0AAV8Z5I7_9CUCU|nr:hypothetical protein NQ318_022022 [Aromia moschata]
MDMDTDTKERPPPYDEGFSNAGYGLSYPPASAPPSVDLGIGDTSNYPSASQPMLGHSPYLYHPPSNPTVIVNQPPPQPSNNVVVVTGNASLPGCPICHNGKWTGTYSCCAWLWCFCCFPVGLICCLCMRKKEVHKMWIYG